MGTRRVNLEGSLFQRASDGRWMGVVHFGYDAQGRPVRRYISATMSSHRGVAVIP